MKMSMPKIPNGDEIIRTFRLIQAEHPTAVIAGGAVRDLIMRKEIKDIDIFIQDPKYAPRKCTDGAPDEPMPDVYQNWYWWNLMKMSQDHRTPSPYGGIYYHQSTETDRLNRVYGDRSSAVANDDTVTAVFTGHKNLIKYDLILTRLRPTEHVNRYFDVGLCKAYFDGKRFRYTADFMRDQKNKTFTVLGQDMTKEGFKRSTEIHIPRIQHKYPGFKTVVAPHNKHLVDK